MTRTHTFIVAIGLGCSTSLLASACLDPTPIAVEASDGGRGEGGTSGACIACLIAPDQPGPGCGTEVSACQANATCESLIACAVASGCFSRPAHALSDVINCGLPCTVEAGVVHDDPALTLGMSVFSCLGTACGGACLEKAAGGD